MRSPFEAEVTLSIGSVVVHRDGVMRPTPFEDANTVERFFESAVFSEPSKQVSGCKVKAMYSPDGGRLRLACKGRGDSEVREMVAAALDPFLDSHSRLFKIATHAEEQRQNHLARKLNSEKLKIDVLQRPPVSSVAEAAIISHREEIEVLQDQMAIDRLLGYRVKATRVEGNGVKVLDRRPGWRTWLVVLTMAIGSGVFVAVFAARLDGARNE